MQIFENCVSINKLNYAYQRFSANERTIVMNALGIVLGILLAIVSIAIIVVIILQEGNQQGLGVVTGAADSYFSKNKARSIDAFLSRWTKVFAAVFVIFVIALNILSYYNLLG